MGGAGDCHYTTLELEVVLVTSTMYAVLSTRIYFYNSIRKDLVVSFV